MRFIFQFWIWNHNRMDWKCDHICQIFLGNEEQNISDLIYLLSLLLQFLPCLSLTDSFFPFLVNQRAIIFYLVKEFLSNPYCLPLLPLAFVLLLVFPMSSLILSQFITSVVHTHYKLDSSPLISLNTSLELLPEFFDTVPPSIFVKVKPWKYTELISLLAFLGTVFHPIILNLFTVPVELGKFCFSSSIFPYWK